jgi:hypothetical protein
MQESISSYYNYYGAWSGTYRIPGCFYDTSTSDYNFNEYLDAVYEGDEQGGVCYGGES